MIFSPWFSDSLMHASSIATSSLTNKTALIHRRMNVMPTTDETIERKKQEIIAFLHAQVFDPILESPTASERLRKGVRFTIMRLEERDPGGMVHYYWSAIIGTDRSTKFARQMKSEGFTRFEEIIADFRERFNDDWLRQT